MANTKHEASYSKAHLFKQKEEKEKKMSIMGDSETLSVHVGLSHSINQILDNASRLSQNLFPVAPPITLPRALYIRYSQTDKAQLQRQAFAGARARAAMALGVRHAAAKKRP